MERKVVVVVVVAEPSDDVPSSARRGRFRRRGGDRRLQRWQVLEGIHPTDERGHFDGVGPQVLRREGGGVRLALEEVSHSVRSSLTLRAQVRGGQSHPLAIVQQAGAISGSELGQRGPEVSRKPILLNADLRRSYI